MTHTTKKRLLLTTLLSGAMMTALSAPSFAQEDDEIIVTGSRIAKQDFTSNSPVATVDAVQFEQTFSINTENLLNTLPQTVPGLDRTSNNPGNGSATVDLRGLGSNRTLVLVNGTRQIPFGQNGVVDLNTIPVSIIENVEVLTGGASSVYGSDALAGVVNFILDDDFSGVEANVGYSITDQGDAGLFNLSTTFGANFDDGRGNVILDFSYANREQLFQGDRDFSEVALFNNADLTGLEPGGSSGTLGTTLFGFSAPDLINAFPDAPATTNGNFLFDQAGNIAPFIAQGDVNDFYNYAPVNFLQLPQERFTITTLGRYEINDKIEAYARGTFSQNTVDSQLAPTPIFVGADFSIDGNPFLTTETQQLLSDSLGSGVDTDGDGIDDTGNGFFGRRLEEVGPRIVNDINNVFQITVGLRGDLNDTWRYDVYFQEGRTTRSTTQSGNVSTGRFQQALLLRDADGDGNVDIAADGSVACADPSLSGGVGATDAFLGTPACVPLNIFGAGNISPDAASFINTLVASTEEFEQTVLQANLIGDLGDFNISGSPIGIAIGGEYIENEADFRPSQDLATGDIAGFNAGPPSGGSFDVYSAYGELNIPLVEGLPFAERVTIDLAGRVDDYNTSGTVFTYKAGGEWAIDDQIRLRGSYNRAVRAPNIAELFAPIAQGFPGAVDPCSAAGNPDATVTALCIALGVPATSVGSLGINTISGQVETLSGGNPDLDVEEADTFTVGVVLTPNLIPDLSFSVDYYDITIDDAIAQFGGGANNVLDICFNDPDLGGVGSQFCDVITRFPGGLIDFISLQSQNVAQRSTSGLDLAGQYSYDAGEWGNFSFNYLATVVFENDFVAFEGADVITCAGEFGTTCGEPDPTYRHRFTSRWNKGPVSAQLVWRLVGSTTDDAFEDGVAANTVSEIDSFNYLDASINWDVNDSLAFTFGVNNLFSKEPPVIGDNDEQANTFPATFDVFGRTLFASAKVRF